MSLLAYEELKKLIQDGVVVGVYDDAINAASIDLTLNNHVMVERPPRPGEVVRPIDLSRGESIPMMDHIMHNYGGEACYDLMPGEFILASSVELFNLPNNLSAEYMQKSSLARSALEHLAAGWCDAGWHGSTLTLELVNVSRYRPLRLRPGMKIGQMKFFAHAEVPEHASYASKGQYNNDLGVQPMKKLR